MAYKIEEKLVIGVASSALFQLDEADSVFRILGQNLHDGSSLMYDCLSPYKGFWGKIKRRLNLR